MYESDLSFILHRYAILSKRNFKQIANIKKHHRMSLNYTVVLTFHLRLDYSNLLRKNNCSDAVG